MARRDSEAPMRARIPANVEKKDVILFGFTFRQVVILTVAALIVYAAWTALARVVHPLVFLVDAIRHRRSPHRLVPADGPITPAPAWVSTTGGRGDKLPLPAPLRLPAKGITPDGLVDLGADGTTALVAASTVAFGLRTPGEQNGLVAGFGRWLNSLDAPVQILVRAERVDLTTVADRIADLAPSLPHPALEAAALSHVAFLDDLAAQRELLHRQVTIAVRDRRGPGHTLHRAAEAVRALAACEVDAAVLDGYDAAGAVAASLSPTGTAGAGASTVNRSDFTGEGDRW